MNKLSFFIMLIATPVFAALMACALHTQEENFRAIIGVPPSDAPGSGPGFGTAFVILFVVYFLFQLVFILLIKGLQRWIQSRLNHHVFIVLYVVLFTVVIATFFHAPGVETRITTFLWIYAGIGFAFQFSEHVIFEVLRFDRFKS